MISDRIYRYERYFRDPIIGNSIFTLDDESIAIGNIKKALNLLGYNVPEGNTYDLELKNSIQAFQET